MNNLDRHDISYDTPVRRWDEGLLCGNGLLGMLLWGDGDPLNLSIDRSDLWDNRVDPQTTREDFRWNKLVELLDRDDMKSVHAVFEKGDGASPPAASR